MSMKSVLGRLIEQRQQLGSERLHLLFGLRAGASRIGSEQGPQPGDLGRELVILSCEDRDFLLSNLGSGLGLVSLLLAELGPVAPEARGRVLSSVTHAATRNGLRAPPPRPPRAPRCRCRAPAVTLLAEFGKATSLSV